MNFKESNIVVVYDKYLRPLNPSGEHEMSCRSLVTAVRLGKIKSLKSIETMAESYKNYVEEWTNVYGSADQVYISKENRLKSFGDFYTARMFKSKSFSKMDSRYIYLFGQIEYEQIEEKHKAFTAKTRSPWT